MQQSVNHGRTSGHFTAVTPHDTNPMADIECAALYVGTAGDISCVNRDGSAVVFKDAIGILPVKTFIVKATGTTATDIVALY